MDVQACTIMYLSLFPPTQVIPSQRVSSFPLKEVYLKCSYSGCFSCSLFSLCLKLLWVLPLPIHRWLLCAPEHHSSLWQVCLLPNDIGSARCGSATKVDSEGHNEGFFWPCQCATVMSTSVPDALQAYANYIMGPPQVSFSFKVEPPWILCNELCFWFLLWCLLSAFRFPCGCPVHLLGLNHWGLQLHNSSWFTIGRHMCLMVMVCDPCQECTK